MIWVHITSYYFSSKNLKNPNLNTGKKIFSGCKNYFTKCDKEIIIIKLNNFTKSSGGILVETAKAR